jgi:hypothetical protein
VASAFVQGHGLPGWQVGEMLEAPPAEDPVR